MTPERFIATRQNDWQALTDLLDSTRNGTKKLPPQQIDQLGKLYRGVTSDLALAQRDFPQHDVTSFLNRLTARTHGVLYRDSAWSMKKLGDFFIKTIPQTFRATIPFFIVATILFYLPAIIVGIAVGIRPELAETFLPVSLHPVIPQVEDHTTWFYFDKSENPAFAAMITTNNIRVTLLAFAGGMTAGILTIIVVVQNSLMLGSLTGLAANHQFYDLFHFIIGHGVIELSMICLGAAAGLMFAWAIIHPAPYSRLDAIFEAGRKALVLFITGALFLIVAGLIEGFISPNTDIPPIFKYAVGILSGAATFAYLLLSGREPN